MNGFLVRTQVVRYCSKPYLCIIFLLAISAPLFLMFSMLYIWDCHFQSNIMMDTGFIPVIFSGQLFLSSVLLILPRALLDIIKAFYTGRINVSKLKENLLLRFICSDDFFLGLSKNSKLSLEDKIIDVITILFYIFLFILMLYFDYQYVGQVSRLAKAQQFIAFKS